MVSDRSTEDKPFRVGVFATVEAAEKAVQNLQRLGFTTGQITVICSDEVKERHFKQFEHEEPAGAEAPVAAATGSVIGALLGGLASVAMMASTGGVGIIAAGPLLAGAGAVVGGLVGAMTTRGVEREIANYYDQAVVHGKILVAAEDHGPDAHRKLALAAKALADAGAEPIALREG